MTAGRRLRRGVTLLMVLAALAAISGARLAHAQGADDLAAVRSLVTRLHGQGKYAKAKLGGRAQHVLVDAEDALIAALRIKTERPEALILYVRPQNRRGDARHPPRTQSKARSE